MVKQEQTVIVNKNTTVCEIDRMKERKEEEEKKKEQCAAVEIYCILLETQNHVLLSEKWPLLQKVCSWHEVIIVVKISRLLFEIDFMVGNI